MKRRDLFALPALILPAIAKAEGQGVETLPMFHPTAWGMFKTLNVLRIQDTMLEKAVDETVVVMGDDCRHCMTVQKPHYVVVPMSDWGSEPTPGIQTRNGLETLLRVTAWDLPWTDGDLNVLAKGYDRMVRISPSLDVAEDLYCFSRGPAGYWLRDQYGRQGAVVYPSRLLIVKAPPPAT